MCRRVVMNHVRGLGSDWDILIKIYDDSTFGEVKNKVLSITNSSEKHLGIKSAKLYQPYFRY